MGLFENGLVSLNMKKPALLVIYTWIFRIRLSLPSRTLKIPTKARSVIQGTQALFVFLTVEQATSSCLETTLINSSSWREPKHQTLPSQGVSWVWAQIQSWSFSPTDHTRSVSHLTLLEIRGGSVIKSTESPQFIICNVFLICSTRALLLVFSG